MKKIISIALLLAMCLSLFAGCSKESTGSADLEGAKKYLEAMLQSDPVDTALDYKLVGVVNVGGVEYTVNWTSDNANIIITREGKMVNVDLPECGAEVVKYVLTATITDGNGNEVTTTFNRRIPASASAGKTPAEIVDECYALADGETLDNVTLTGKIVKIVSGVNPQYNSMRFTIAVEGCEDKPILCYNIKGDKVSNDICVGDTATVNGVVKNYQGTIEFDTDCVLVELVPCGIEKPTDSKVIVDQAFALEPNTSMPYIATLTGTITKINEAYSASYGNITVTMAVEGSDGTKLLKCYRLKGVGADTLAVSDTITVTGIIKNYQHSSGDCEVEFDSGCTLGNVVKGDGTTPEIPDDSDEPSTEKPSDPKQIVDSAFALEPGASLPYTATLTGKITKINTEFSTQFNNITVTIEVEGTAGTKQLKCYRLKGTGADALAVGDVITVSGTIKNYQHSSGDTEVEFDAGCTLDKVVKADDVTPDDPQNPDEPTPQPSDAPEVGVAYKFGMIQENISTTDVYYLAGGMDGYYMATTTNVTNAIDIYVEETAGGYYLYTMDGSNKVYINMVVSGTHVNGAYEAAASTVYSWDAENATMVATVNDELYWFATRNDKTYDTIGPCKVSYNGFYCMFYAA